MSSALDQRRSSRKRKRNSKYTNDAFEGLDIELGDSDREIEPIILDDAESDDFAPDLAAEAEEIEEDEILEEGEEGVSAEEDGANDQPGEEPSDGDEEIIHIDSPTSDTGSTRPNMPKLPNGRRTGMNAYNREKPLAGEVHSRGLRWRPKHDSRDVAIAESYGRDEVAKVSLLKMQDRWFDEVSMPSRRLNTKGRGGLAHSFFVTDEKREHDAMTSWDWYYDAQKGQLLKDVQEERRPFHATSAKQEDEIQQFRPAKMEERHCLVGRIGHEAVCRVSLGQSLDVGPQALSERETEIQEMTIEPMNGGGIDATPGAAAAHSSANASNGGLQDGSTESRGNARKQSRHLLHVGEAVKSLDWCPNQDSTNQFLAVATMRHSMISQEDWQGDESETAPAFGPEKPRPSTIQIWKFRSEEATVADEAVSFNKSYRPRLHVMLCMKFGTIKQIKWCPVPRKARAVHQADEIYLGLLAVLCGDGHVRILDVSVPRDDEEKPAYIMIDRAAWTGKPPDTICTCMTWVSSSRILAGCANGNVVLWDISQPTTRGSTTPKPLLYIPLDTTYILAIESCRPSRPDFFLSTSMSGTLRLVDLKSPMSSTVSAARARIGTTVLAWNEHLQHALTGEETQAIRAHNVRQLFQASLLTHEESGMLCVATSELHPVALFGRADGTCLLYNPVRRVMSRKTGKDHYRQRWFVHEWRRPMQKEVTNGAENGGAELGDFDGHKADALIAAVDGDVVMADASAPADAPATPDYPNGLSRISTGFAVESITYGAAMAAVTNKQKGTTGRTKKGKTVVQEGGVVFSTIFELQTGVTAVAWNPNMRCGTWAAAGCGDGLVVVEDLGWEGE